MRQCHTPPPVLSQVTQAPPALKDPREALTVMAREEVERYVLPVWDILQDVSNSITVIGERSILYSATA